MGFDKWIKEINNQVGTLIGIGQSTTHIFLISDFVKDEKKKTEIEKRFYGIAINNRYTISESFEYIIGHFIVFSFSLSGKPLSLHTKMRS